MRLYSFANYYLSPLQHGLQTAHCVSDMSMAYAKSDPAGDVYAEWAAKHKTIIICNGGNSAMLQTLFEQLTELGKHFGLPVVKFHEDEQSLAGALTTVAMILPEWVYDAVFVKGTIGPDFYGWNHEHLSNDIDMPTRMNFIDGSKQFALISLVKSHRLA